MRTIGIVLFLAACSENQFSSVDKVTTPSDPEPPPLSTPTTTPTTTTPTTPVEDTGHPSDTGTTPTTNPYQPLEPVADAGADAFVVAGDTTTLDGSLSFDPQGFPLTKYKWTLVSAPAGSTAALAVLDTVTTDFTTDVHGNYTFELTVQNQAGLWDSTPDQVQISADVAPPVSDAGIDATYTPLQTVQLDGTASYDPEGLTPLTYAWTMVSKPLNSTATLNNPTLASPTFFADLAGDYVLDLTVTNALGVVDPTPDEVVITTQPADGFYVELSWATTADLDLHLLNDLATGIYDCPNDCNWDKPAPSWDNAGTNDDPSLDEDTIPGVSGSGPEVITITIPSTDTFTIKAHYYGEGGFVGCQGACPATDATVNIYLGGILGASYTRNMKQDGDVWTVATIDWPSGLITPIDTLGATGLTSCN